MPDLVLSASGAFAVAANGKASGNVRYHRRSMVVAACRARAGCLAAGRGVLRMLAFSLSEGLKESLPVLPTLFVLTQVALMLESRMSSCEVRCPAQPSTRSRVEWHGQSWYLALRLYFSCSYSASCVQAQRKHSTANEVHFWCEDSW